MAKFYGAIGFAESVEIRPGVHKEEIKEYNYYGDLERISRRLQAAEKTNDDINIANVISIIADPYARDHFHSMRYVKLNGVAWKVSDVEVQFPRLRLTVGGLYNNGK